MSDEKDSQARLSNTGLGNDNTATLPALLKTVASGVDTVILNVRRPVPDWLVANVEQLRTAELAAAAAAEREPSPVPSGLSFVGSELHVLPHGRKSWRFVLHGEFLDLQLVRGGVANVHAQLRLSAAYLWSRPYDQALMEAVAFVSEVFGREAAEDMQVSEVHLCRDVSGLDLGAAWNDVQPNLVTRADTMTPIFKHYRLESVQVGSRSSPVSCVLYNKCKEIFASGKLWMYAIWNQNGWDGQSPIWRCEFRLKRDFLRSAAINTVPELIEKLPHCWAYCVEDWLRHVAGEDSNVSRRQVSVWWLEYMGRFDPDSPGVPVTREVKHALDADKLVKQAAGCMVTAGALLGCVVPDDIGVVLIDRITDILEVDGLTFEGLLKWRLSRYEGRG